MCKTKPAARNLQDIEQPCCAVPWQCTCRWCCCWCAQPSRRPCGWRPPGGTGPPPVCAGAGERRAVAGEQCTWAAGPLGRQTGECGHERRAAAGRPHQPLQLLQLLAAGARGAGRGPKHDVAGPVLQDFGLQVKRGARGAQARAQERAAHRATLPSASCRCSSCGALPLGGRVGGRRQLR